ncbi:hypothetical protein [Rubrolithibacter danxiaensis]|uniref:hypothetical protein n=1 Tax=Rubrolithibacter danxiaensis TaxID=3390805 RepID=UPI003BF8EDBE
MGTLNFEKIIQESSAISKEIVGKAWKNLKPYAEHEFCQFAENIEFLTQLKIKNQISDEEFKARIEIQRLSLKNVLLAIEGIGLITAQEVVNAVIGIVSKFVEEALHIAILI